MKYEFITTNNYIRIIENIEYLLKLPSDAPKLGCFYGQYGIGKTLSLDKIANTYDGYVLECDPSWTYTSFLKKLAEMVGAVESTTSNERLAEIIQILSRKDTILIFDEFDRLFDFGKLKIVEIIRYIHDKSNTIIIAIGMEKLLTKIGKNGAYYTRLARKIKLENNTKEDFESFCGNSDITIKDDLVQYFYEKWGNLRFVRVFIENLESYCGINQLQEANLECFKISGAEDLTGLAR